MVVNYITLEHIRLPGHAENPLLLDNSPLRILDGTSLEGNDADLSTANGTATILYNWCPEALFALLDIEAWFSFTWTVTLEDETKLEIGRIRNQVTMGKLDKEGLWKVMITFNISQLENGLYQGSWMPNTEETMLGDQNVDDPKEIERLGREFVAELIKQRRWLTGKKIRHEFFIESLSLGMDPWDDGLAMNPHWLYETLDLARCSTCKSGGQHGKSLNRCGRCGTAAYCSSECQQKDWSVHKAVCAMSAEDRGKALRYSQNGGLVNWVGEGGGPEAEEEEVDGE
ncbi:uncharacterized protein RCC_03696 [Ramularia collo-cygni]|uniref:MYND-type domain-containing protein n=1 Tax=Ramularia collo-cygni TaxID=112498 RepID=A0A2D3UXG9_9PEZI|nr:uncharacterized protein RCC_03696 [Ramularia collo-cygni]CZT17860.1 uncharacterized protein RCC_03696 [Ramularia collo-cygni]